MHRTYACIDPMNMSLNFNLLLTDPQTYIFIFILVSQEQTEYCMGASSVSAGVDLVVTACAADANDPMQAWEWVPVGGRHKAYGQFRLASSKSLHHNLDLCFTQMASTISSGGDDWKKFQTIVGLMQCQPVATLPCGQVWTVSTALERVAHAKPRAIPLTQKLKRSAPKILCWVLTYPKAHELKATSINATWGRHCTTLLFMTTEHYEGLSTVTVNIGGEEDRGRLW